MKIQFFLECFRSRTTTSSSILIVEDQVCRTLGYREPINTRMKKGTTCVILMLSRKSVREAPVKLSNGGRGSMLWLFRGLDYVEGIVPSVKLKQKLATI